MTESSEIIDALKLRHLGREWLFFPELRLGTGYGGKWEQRIDAWAMSCYPSTGLQSISYEVKVSRSDFLHELAQPGKRQAAMEMSNLFYFAAPAGIIGLDELPTDCGLVEFRAGKTRIVSKATFRDRERLPWRFLASVGRRIIAAGERPDYIDIPIRYLNFNWSEFPHKRLFSYAYANAMYEIGEEELTYEQAAHVLECAAASLREQGRAI
jgi:hypothetical protein